MRPLRTVAGCASPLALTLLCLGLTAESVAADTFDLSTGVLTIPTLGIGHATFFNVVISDIAAANIVSLPLSGSPSGSEDTYDPANQHLTIPSVTVSGYGTFHNVVLVLGASNPVTIGSVSGADTFTVTGTSPLEGTLTVADVTLGTIAYQNVVVTNEPASDVVSFGSGLPTLALDSFNALTGTLAIPALEIDNAAVVTNIVVKLGGSISSVGGGGSVAPPSILGVVANTGSAGSYTSSVTLWDLTNRVAPSPLGTLSNPVSGYVSSIAIDATGNAYYLASTGTFYACTIASNWSCTPGPTIANGKLLAVDAQGNAYVTALVSGAATGVVTFPVTSGSGASLLTAYSSTSIVSAYTGLAVSQDGSTIYVGEGGGSFTSASVHACSIPCASAGGTNVSSLLLAGLSGAFFPGGLSGAVAIGSNDTLYAGLSGSNATSGPQTFIAMACTPSGTLASPTAFTCTPGAGGGSQGYPLVEGDLSPFAVAPAIAVDAGGNVYVAADLTTFGGPAISPTPATLSAFSGPSKLYKDLNPFAVAGPTGPAIATSAIFAPYALAATP